MLLTEWTGGVIVAQSLLGVDSFYCTVLIDVTCGHGHSHDNELCMMWKGEPKGKGL